jgi:hypothetical protein
MARTPVARFGSHLPVLIRAVAITDGPVLEMGMGYGSSPFLHWACATNKRPLVSYENQPEYFRFARDFAADFHEVHCISNWTKADIERPWDVAFVDYFPGGKRSDSVRRLANFAKYIVIHDSEGRNETKFHYRQIYPLFKWQYNYNHYLPKTSVLSNFVDLNDFGAEWE